MKIIDLTLADDALKLQAAELLVSAFQTDWPASYNTLGEAITEVEKALQPGKILRVAVSEQGEAIGWVGGISQYDGNVWELHPLAVHPDYQGNGIGAALVQDFEAQVKVRGGITIILGTDDENNLTSLSGVDLYQDLPTKIAEIKNYRHHPYEFYQKQGYTIVGVVPDANGIGKPDIMMAKRVG